MAWSAALIARMGARSAAWVLRLSVRAAFSSSAASTFYDWAYGRLPPGDLAMDGVVYWGTNAHRIMDPDPDLLLPNFYVDPKTLIMPEQRLDVANWTCNGGQWSIEIQDTFDTEQAAWLVPGQYIELALGAPGYTHEEFGRIAAGVLVNVTKLPTARLRLLVYDLKAMLNGDILCSSVPFGDPFFETNLASAYTAGDATLTVGGGVGASFDPYRDKDGLYTLVLEPASGDPFILKAASRTGDVFSVTTNGQFGTTAVTISDTTNPRVRCAYRLEGHPFNVVARMLASTGTGTNGTFDEEPAQVGYGLPEELIDEADIIDWKPAIDPPADDFAIEFPIADLGTTTHGDRPTTITEGLRELQRRLGQAGLFVVQRQGAFTCRALQDLYDTPITTGMTITIRDIALPTDLYCEWYVMERGEEIQAVRVTTNDGNATTDGTDNPPRLAVKRGQATEDLDCTPIIWNNGATGEVADSILARVAPWHRERLMRLRVTLGGLHWMRLCPGDVVSVDFSTGVPGMRGEAANVLCRGRTADVDGDPTGGTAGGFTAWKMMVESTRSLLPAPAVTLSLLCTVARGQDWDPAGPTGTPGGQVPLLP